MFLDLTVVYFSFGAPLGVYEIARNKRSARATGSAVLHLVLWPLFAAASLRRSLAPVPPVSVEQQIDDLRTEFEAGVFDGRTSEGVLEFRDVYARYTGLALALRRANGEASNEIFDLARHGNRKLAAKCLGRLNRRRLEFHLLQARNELEAVVTILSGNQPDLVDLSQRLEVLLDVRP